MGNRPRMVVERVCSHSVKGSRKQADGCQYAEAYGGDIMWISRSIAWEIWQAIDSHIQINLHIDIGRHSDTATDMGIPTNMDIGL